MAGKPKQGIDFAGWNVDIFDNDTKIDELLDAQGWIGFSIYFYLCQKAYGSDGYFYRWSFANAATTARKMGGGISSETVKQTVSVCLRIGLFDKGLFDRGILTSKGIQRRYAKAIEKRSHRFVQAEYWIIPPDESGNVIAVQQNDHSLPENGYSLHGNGDSRPQSKVNKTIGNKSTGNEDEEADASGCHHPPAALHPEYDTIKEKAESYGLPTFPGNIEFACELANRYTTNWVLRAIAESGKGASHTWAYVSGILANWKRQGSTMSEKDFDRMINEMASLYEGGCEND